MLFFCNYLNDKFLEFKLPYTLPLRIWSHHSCMLYITVLYITMKEIIKWLVGYQRQNLFFNTVLSGTQSAPLQSKIRRRSILFSFPGCRALWSAGDWEETLGVLGWRGLQSGSGTSAGFQAGTVRQRGLPSRDDLDPGDPRPGSLHQVPGGEINQQELVILFDTFYSSFYIDFLLFFYFSAILTNILYVETCCDLRNVTKLKNPECRVFVNWQHAVHLLWVRVLLN